MSKLSYMAELHYENLCVITDELKAMGNTVRLDVLCGTYLTFYMKRTNGEIIQEHFNLHEEVSIHLLGEFSKRLSILIKLKKEAA